MKRPLILLALYAAAGAAPSSASAADLLAVYQRALQNDPQLREAEATRLATLESKPQALANLLPQLSAGGIVSREHDNGSSNIVQPVTIAPVPPATGPGTTVLEAFPFAGQTQTTARRYGFDLKQNLFRWENWVALQ
ncbi:MAG TPA: TolC family protein, partial [Steroidobacteraceae bacterium]|nr:TolC family protein [Steroidobacteraceae bacterium]